MDVVGLRWTDRTIRSVFLADDVMVANRLLRMTPQEAVSGMVYGAVVPMALSRGSSR